MQIWGRVCLLALIQRLHLRDLPAGCAENTSDSAEEVVELQLHNQDLKQVLWKFLLWWVSGSSNSSKDFSRCPIRWVRSQSALSIWMVFLLLHLMCIPYFSGTTVLVLLGWYFSEIVMWYVSNLRILRGVKGAGQVFLNFY